jgi:hypothetical protein
VGGGGVARVDRYWSSILNGTWYRRLFLTAKPSNTEPPVSGIPVPNTSAVTRDQQVAFCSGAMCVPTRGLWVGWDSSVGIATRYGLHGPGLETL